MYLKTNSVYSFAIFTIFILLFLPTQVTAQVLPIARYDVAPHQRIEKGETFNFGVIAFHKDGIDRVVFEVTGAGYNGPESVTVTEMTLNPRTDVWEYWFPLSASSFTQAGNIQVKATVHSNDGASYVPSALSQRIGLEQTTGRTFLNYIPMTVNSQRSGRECFLNPNPTQCLPTVEAWVNPSVSSTAGSIGNSNNPYPDISDALADIRDWRSANGYGATVDGAVIHVVPFGSGDSSSSHELEMGEFDTISEYVTVTSDPTRGGNTANTRISKLTSINKELFVKIENLQIISKTNPVNGSPLNGNDFLFLLVTNSFLTGTFDTNSSTSEYKNPFRGNFDDKWVINSRIEDVYFAVGSCTGARNLDVVRSHQDVFQNCPFIVNITVNGIDPIFPDGRPTYDHSDLWQFWGGGTVRNAIAYNVHATDVHYQGAYINVPRVEGMAIVNTFIERRRENRLRGSASNNQKPAPTLISLNADFHHLLLWHNTQVHFEDRYYNVMDGTDYGPFGAAHVSIVGNSFKAIASDVYNLNDQTIKKSNLDKTLWMTVGNPQNIGNKFLYNHYEPRNTIGDYGSLYARFPDDEPGGIQTKQISLQTNILDSDRTSDTFGHPIAGSSLRNAIDVGVLGRVYVPADIYGNPRDNFPDIGPFEVQGDGTPGRVSSPSFSPAPGTYTSPVNVTISSATSGAVVHYTTDGSTPTKSSPIASGAINISTTTILKAKAFKDGLTDSIVNTATYTIGEPPEPPRTGLQAYWKFDDGSGTSAQDNSGNENTGTLRNGANFVTAGKLGSAVSFDGVDDSVHISGASLPSESWSALTLAAWVKSDVGNDGKTHDIIGEWNYPSSRSYILTHHRNGQYFFEIAGKGNVSGGTVSTAWTHVAATYEAGVMKLFVNGQEVASKGVSGGNLPASSANIVIGSQDNPSNYFDGLIDEVVIYNSRLTASEIQNLMTNGPADEGDTEAPNTPSGLQVVR